MSDKQQELSKKEPVNGTSFTKEFREQIIEIWDSGIYTTMAECARNYNVPEKLFYQWVAKANKQSLPQELIRLRKDVKRLNEELTILKKAAAYFAKEMK